MSLVYIVAAIVTCGQITDSGHKFDFRCRTSGVDNRESTWQLGSRDRYGIPVEY
ncbi:hypothetical protein J6590_041594 [Homalodisca vitripennis]|nr:hypothetical protein J6590_041594 [Homalodisca vitripennis]